MKIECKVCGCIVDYDENYICCKICGTEFNPDYTNYKQLWNELKLMLNDNINICEANWIQAKENCWETEIIEGKIEIKLSNRLLKEMTEMENE